MHRSKLLATAIVSLTLVIGLAACGSSSSDGEKSTTTKASGDATTTTKDDGDDTTTTEADDDTSTTVVATGGGDFCDDLADYINESSMSDIDVTDPEAYKQALKDSTEKSKDLLSKAPDELNDSVEVLVEFQDEIVAELEKVDYDFTKLSPDVMSGADDPKLEAANDELTAYVEDTCGIDLPDAPVAESPDLEVPTTVAN